MTQPSTSTGTDASSYSAVATDLAPMSGGGRITPGLYIVLLCALERYLPPSTRARARDAAKAAMDAEAESLEAVLTLMRAALGDAPERPGRLPKAVQAVVRHVWTDLDALRGERAARHVEPELPLSSSEARLRRLRAKWPVNVLHFAWCLREAVRMSEAER